MFISLQNQVRSNQFSYSQGITRNSAQQIGRIFNSSGNYNLPDSDDKPRKKCSLQKPTGVPTGERIAYIPVRSDQIEQVLTTFESEYTELKTRFDSGAYWSDSDENRLGVVRELLRDYRLQLARCVHKIPAQKHGITPVVGEKFVSALDARKRLMDRFAQFIFDAKALISNGGKGFSNQQKSAIAAIVESAEKWQNGFIVLPASEEAFFKLGLSLTTVWTIERKLQQYSGLLAEVVKTKRPSKKTDRAANAVMAKYNLQPYQIVRIYARDTTTRPIWQAEFKCSLRRDASRNVMLKNGVATVLSGKKLITWLHKHGLRVKPSLTKPIVGQWEIFHNGQAAIVEVSSPN